MNKEAFKEGFVEGLRVMHTGIIHILCIPLYIYYCGMDFANHVLDMNHKLKDWYFLRRIRMTREEFDEFMDYKIHGKDSLRESEEIIKALELKLHQSGMKTVRFQGERNGERQNNREMSASIFDLEGKLAEMTKERDGYKKDFLAYMKSNSAEVMAHSITREKLKALEK